VIAGSGLVVMVIVILQGRGAVREMVTGIDGDLVD
jgi:hypothetical protein